MNKLIKIVQSAWFKWVTAAFILICLICCVDVQATLSAFKNVTPKLLIFFLYISVVLIYLSALKWQLFIEEGHKRHISVFKLFAYYVLGYFINVVGPAYVGGDAVRSWYAGKEVGDKHQAFAATVLERYTGVVAMFILALVFMWQVELVTFNLRMLIVVLAFAVAVGTYLVLHPNFINLLEKICPAFKRFSPHCRKIQDVLRYAHKQPLLLLKAFILSFLFHICTVVNVVVAGLCIGWLDIPYYDLFVVLPLILLIGFVPISPNGLGVQEAAYFYFMQGLGATNDQALAIGLALRAKSYFLALCGGIIWLYLGKEKKN